MLATRESDRSYQIIQRKNKIKANDYISGDNIESDVQSNINPFYIILLAIFISGTLAGAFAIINNKVHNYSELDHIHSIPYSVNKLKSNDLAAGDLWEHVTFGEETDIVTIGSITVIEWNTDVGKIRSMKFAESRGIEGGHIVECDKDDNCVGKWGSNTSLMSSYLHSTILGLVTTVVDGFECPANIHPHVLQIGLGTGTVTSFIQTHCPNWQQTVIEVSQEVIDFQPYFGVRQDDKTTFLNADANKYFTSENCHHQYDAFVIDAYDFEDKVPSGLFDIANMKTCLVKKNGVFVMNIVITVLTDEEATTLMTNFKNNFRQVFLLETNFFNRILVAHDFPDSIDQQELFYRSEYLHRRCKFPLLERGRGFWYDATNNSVEDVLKWLRADNRQQPCVGLACLLL